MLHFIRRFSDWFALCGLVFLLAGMLGTARQIKELSLMSASPPPEGFLPILVEVPPSPVQGKHAPQLQNQAVSSLPQPSVEVLAEQKAPLPTVPPEPPEATASTPAGSEIQATGTPAAVETAPPAAALEPVLPDWIEIPAIGLDAPVVPVDPEQVSLNGKVFEQWTAPNMTAAGWHDRSSRLGEPGNLVLNGHNNIFGSIFARLKDLQVGDVISLYGQGRQYTYVVAQVMLLEERNVTVDVRADNARWILPSDDTRLTLVTCWPPESNTHRLIVVAQSRGYP